MAYSFEKNEFSCLFLHMIELFQQNCPLNSHLRLAFPNSQGFAPAQIQYKPQYN